MALRDILKMSQGRITPDVSGLLLRTQGDIRAVKDTTINQVTRLIISSGHDPKDRSGAWHPSQLAKCLRKQTFEFWGVPGAYKASARMANLYADGHWRHLRWQVLLLEAGVVDSIEVPVEMTEYNVRGSMDAEAEDFFVEIKGTRFISDVRKGPMDEHIDQVHGYFLATGHTQCIMIYEDKQSQEFVELVVDRDDHKVDELEDRLQYLNDMMFARQLPDPLSPDSEDCKWCVYSSFCRDVESVEQAVNVRIP